jgi:hypothetical protein
MKLEFSRHTFTNNLTSNSIKIRPVGAELFNADGRTDMTELLVFFELLLERQEEVNILPTDYIKVFFVCT